MSFLRRLTCLLAAIAPLLLAGCDLLGIESPEQVAARRESDGKAIGGGCRHAGRSVEECYQLNRRADRAAVFAGWKEMHEYMAANKIEEQPPPPPAASAPESASGDDDSKVAASGNKAEPRLAARRTP